MPREDTNFMQTFRAGRGNMRQSIRLRDEVLRVPVDFRKDNQRDGQISGSVEDDRQQSQHGRGNTKKGAAQSRAEGLKRRKTSQRNRESHRHGEEPSQQKAKAGNPHCYMPTIAQQTSHRLTNGKSAA